MKKILEYLKGIIGAQLMELFIQRLVTAENVIKAKNYIFDKILDPIEDYCKENNFSWDDKALKTIREALDVPDNDAPAK